ncbi:hypothetical protein [uncultured Azonexus sp.]|uniref:hypothetical protein n=1 Tax=uncultured Azonexus sp. TaxID=520307 RepID=UPI002637671C|nr:hypothetical protein [uncultured Azonexus sp.]
MLQQQGHGQVVVEMLPGQTGAGLRHVEADIERAGGIMVALHAACLCLQLSGPVLHGRGVMVELADRSGEGAHLAEDVRREGEVQYIYVASADFVSQPGVAMMQRAVEGAVAKTSPGGEGGAEAVEAVGVIIDRAWHAQ